MSFEVQVVWQDESLGLQQFEVDEFAEFGCEVEEGKCGLGHCEWCFDAGSECWRRIAVL